jgi:hypothetical protein
MINHYLKVITLNPPKRNEEFIKKKWKEFLKFLYIEFQHHPEKRNKVKEMYKRYHRDVVLNTMKKYDNDIKKFRLEWV